MSNRFSGSDEKVNDTMALTSTNPHFGLIGISEYSCSQGTFFGLKNYLNDIALRYNKSIIIVETEYPFTDGEIDGLENIIRSQYHARESRNPERTIENIGKHLGH
jgi:arabinogalactan endo-1,4-beta-galactosidase